MKSKKITLDQLTILGANSLTLLNYYIKEQNEAKKESQTELVNYLQKEIDKISDLLTELKLM